MASISARSRGGLTRSAVAIDDAGPVEVVGRDLHPDAIAGQDADAEAPHLPGHVAEDLMAVVELHPEHGVRERLDDLSFELDLLFLRQTGCRPLSPLPHASATAREGPRRGVYTSRTGCLPGAGRTGSALGGA